MKVLCELLENQYHIAGYFDNNVTIQKEYRGLPNLGTWDDFLHWNLEQTKSPPIYFIVSIGPGRGEIRQSLHEAIKAQGLVPITAIHRTSFVANSATVGEGSQIYAKATVCVDAQIGKACIINTGASVDHECVIEDGASIGPGATLAGLVKVGKNADVYSGAVILPRLTIGEGAVVGAGAVVLKDVAPFTTVVGNPARIIKTKIE